MPRSSVAEQLVAYGRELEAQGAAQIGDSFSGDPEADRLLRTDPNAFLIGLLFTQGIPAERAWAGPYLLAQRMGGFDMRVMAGQPAAVRDAVQRPPMLHRFKETLPRWITSAARRILDEWDGDASAIWSPGTHVVEVTERLSEFDGIGRKKAVMGAELLSRVFGAELVGRECGTVAYDVHVRRVFLRTGLVDVDTREEMEAAAARAYPDAPGTLDLAAWLIGRETCRPRAPRCDECRLGDVCPRLVDRQVSGVGVRRGTSRSGA